MRVIVYYGNCDTGGVPTAADMQEATNLIGCEIERDDTLLSNCEPDTTCLASPEKMYVACRVVSGTPNQMYAKGDLVEVCIEN